MRRRFYSRRSVRLKNHSYGPGTTLFITFNVAQREHLLGAISDGRMSLSAIGSIVDRCIRDMGELSYIELHAHVVMPDHVHVLFTILDNEPQAPYKLMKPKRLFGQTQQRTCWSVISQLKSRCTKQIWDSNPSLHGRKIWQRGFHDRVVEGDFTRVKHYIVNNPKNWRHTR